MAIQKTIAFLAPFPADEVRNPVGAVETALVNMETLISIIDDLSDLTSLKVGTISQDATKAALERIKKLSWIIEEERARALESLYLIDDAAAAHLEYRIAA
jgi:hypothetical protein